MDDKILSKYDGPVPPMSSLGEVAAARERFIAMVDMLAGAFFKETGLRPSEAEAVWETEGNTIRVYFRKKEPRA